MILDQRAVFHRNMNKPPEVVICGGPAHMISLDTATGKHIERIDISSGAGVACLGNHANYIKDAMAAQLNDMPYVHSGNWTTTSVALLANALLQIVGTVTETFQEGAVLFLNTGAEANEAACKIAMQYVREAGLTNHPMFVGREYSYHGNTMFTLALGDHPRKRDYIIHLPDHAVRRAPAFAPTWQAHLPKSYTTDVLSDTRRVLAQAACPIMIIEPIGGTTLGIEPPTVEYLDKLRKLVMQQKGVLIYDEVLSGNYRTGEFLSFMHYSKLGGIDLAPDIITIGKGLTGGYFPLSAVIVSSKIANAIRNGSGVLKHSTTSMNHPVGCAAGLAALQVYEVARKDIANQAFVCTEMFADWTRDFDDDLDDVVGVGSLWGIRFDPRKRNVKDSIRKQLFDMGVAAYVEGGTVMDGGNFVLFAPPYCMSSRQLAAALEALGKVRL